ncbi:ABC transporter permease [Rhodoglobus aureus]|uniref:Transport permease protein n=1 Tax=Rhodoglobus aureus TaxID=191497 RepID=A0ABP4G4V2_9MICO
MSTTSSAPVTATGRTSRSSLGASLGRNLRLGASRIKYEVRAYFRQGDSVFFTFLFPVVMLTIFSLAFSEQNFGSEEEPLTAAAFYLPGMIAAGLLLSGLQNMAIDIAMEKSDGTLKRFAGTPLPVMSYFIGKIGQVFVTGVLQATLVILVASVAFGVELPNEPSKWLTFAWVFVLGVTTSAVLGIALSALPRTGKSATAVVIPIALILQFISGVYLGFSLLPTWLQNVASAFPLKWMAQGMREVFLPASFEVLEQSESWNLPGVAIATGLWLVIGLIVTRITFRWIRKDS